MEINNNKLRLFWISTVGIIVLFVLGVLLLEKLHFPFLTQKNTNEETLKASLQEQKAEREIVLVEPIEEIDSLEREIFALLDKHFSFHLSRMEQSNNDFVNQEEANILKEIEAMKQMRIDFLANIAQFRKRVNELFDNFDKSYRPVSSVSRVFENWDKAITMCPIYIEESVTDYVYKIECGDIYGDCEDQIAITIDGRLMNIVLSDVHRKIWQKTKVSSVANMNQLDFGTNVVMKILLPEDADAINSKAKMQYGCLMIFVPKVSLNRNTIRVPIQ